MPPTMRFFLASLLWMSSLQAIEASQVNLRCGKCERGSSSLTCPSSFDMQYELVFEPVSRQSNNHLMHVKCQADGVPLNLTFLEGCSFPNVQIVKFSLCYLSPNVTFADLLTRLGVLPSHMLDLIYSYYDDGAYPRKLDFGSILFDGLSNLTSMHIRDRNFSSISKDAFINTPKLKSLFLAGNRFGKLPSKVFSPLVKLKKLAFTNNELEYLQNDTFESLLLLEELNLRSNKIGELNANQFSNLAHLQRIYLGKNNLGSLPENIFSSCTNLSLVDLSDNKLENVSLNLFSYNLHIKYLYLQKNNLSSIPQDFLSGLDALIKLDLSFNKLTTLPEAVFFSNKNLSSLRLNSNLLEELPGDIFRESKYLETIDMGRNRLTHIPSFSQCRNIKQMYLQRNNLSGLSPLNFPSYPFGEIAGASLETIDLSHNNLDENNIAPQFIFALANQLKLQRVNLSNNNFTSNPITLGFFNFRKLQQLDLSNNSISGVNLYIEFSGMANYVNVDLRNNLIDTVIVPFRSQLLNYSIYLSGNKFSCDCRSYDLAKFLQQKNHLNQLSLGILDGDQLKCSTPDEFANKTISKVELSKFVCNSPPGPHCSQNCSCMFRRSDKVMTVECSSKNLTTIPDFHSRTDFNYAYDLSRNSINNIDFSDEILEKLTNLTLMGNNISSESIKNVSKLPDQLTYLDLRDNKLSYLPEKFAQTLNRSHVKVRLDDNPWICDCNLKELLKYLQTSYTKVLHPDNIRCVGSKRLLIDLKIGDLCPFYVEPAFIAGTTIAALVFVVFVILGVVLFYRYKNAIMVWLFAHKLCLWLITRDELDGDKKYDAFISYSHKDETFVMDTLVRTLETEPPKYKLCIHHRDWIPGELIYQQILNSVNDSRRTIVVLSVDFLQSEWGHREFQQAYQQTLKDKANRVIVIVYGELPPESSMDKDLLQYIKLHTYLKWGNPKFWDQLRYAMPHSKNFRSKKRNHTEDKLELVNGHSKQSLQV